MQCLYPDCDFTADLPKTHATVANTERLKRIVIDHINHDHDDAHVIIACLHELEEVERFTAVARDPSGVETHLPQIRYQCARCDQFEVRDDEEPSTTTEGDAHA